ncbi:hypothetical protein [Streptomyces lydicus]|uniref:hypothetical protein n=1 Tax=Streptomyces lydicus TaxID=47763 RepID=UPI0036EE17FE
METTATFCTFRGPARVDDPAESKLARRTFEHDSRMRTRSMFTSPRGTDSPTGASRTVFDAKRQETLSGVPVWAESDQPSNDATVNRAYAALGATFEFYLKVYGRRSVDGNGQPRDTHMSRRGGPETDSRLGRPGTGARAPQPGIAVDLDAARAAMVAREGALGPGLVRDALLSRPG